MQLMLPFWQRLLITVAAMLVASFVVDTILWRYLLGFSAGLPSYVSGLVGGLAALPVWDWLKRIRPTPKSAT